MSGKTIITDVEKLHRKSEPIEKDSAETNELLSSLKHSLPERQLGLAAPQIDVHKRVFVAWLPGLERTLGFVNPFFIEKSEIKVPSTEGCLSLPDVMRTVERCASVTIDAERIVEFKENDDFSDIQGPIELSSLESFIVQHETDHLEGTLITDLPAVKSNEEKLKERAEKRQAKINAKREAKKAKNKASNNKIGAKKPKSKKDAEKEKKQARKQRKRERKIAEIAERYKAKQEGLFDPIE